MGETLLPESKIPGLKFQMPSWEEICKWETNAWSRHEAGMSELGSQGGTCPPPAPRGERGERLCLPYYYVTLWIFKPSYGHARSKKQTLVREQINQEPGSKVLLRMIIFMGIKSPEKTKVLSWVSPLTALGKNSFVHRTAFLGSNPLKVKANEKKIRWLQAKIWEHIKKIITKWR